MEKLCCFKFAGHSSDESGKGKNYQGQTKAAYGFSLIKGKADHAMEDYHVAKFVQINGQELGLFAIFDGHLGDSVPAYLQKHLFQNILKEVGCEYYFFLYSVHNFGWKVRLEVSVSVTVSADTKSNTSRPVLPSVLTIADDMTLPRMEEFWIRPDRAITKAYDKTDQAILSHDPQLGRGGSTAVTAILVDLRKLWIANVGDSRAVLSRGGRAIQITVDHEPGTERGSIERRGGFVSNMPGDVPRVNGQLAVSRAFGDTVLKSYLRSDPDVYSEDISLDTELLILASDGLWKVMSNQEAVELAMRIKDPQAAAKQLAYEAVSRGSRDDISCIVIRFKA